MRRWWLACAVTVGVTTSITASYLADASTAGPGGLRGAGSSSPGDEPTSLELGIDHGDPDTGGAWSLVTYGTTTVAVGSLAPSLDEPGPATAPAIWRSGDLGASFERIHVAGDGALAAVSAAGDGFVAVGTRTTATGSHALVMTSPDGFEWEERSVDGEGLRLTTVLATPRGPVLAGARDQGVGPEPYVLVPSGDGWQGSVVRVDGRAVAGEVRGGCVAGDELVLVGHGPDDRAVRRPLLLRSADHGDRWAQERLTGALLHEGGASAVGCAFLDQDLVVAGNLILGPRRQAFLSLEDAASGAWQPALRLEPRRREATWSTAARGVAIAGAHVVVVGEDWSAVDGAGAVWLIDATGSPRRSALEEKLAQDGWRGATAVSAGPGHVLVAAMAARGPAFVSSPVDVTLTLPQPGSADDWPRTYGSIDPCTLLDDHEVARYSGRSGLQPRGSPAGEGYTACGWGYHFDPEIVTVELAPPDRLGALATAYAPDLDPPVPLASSCSGATFYPTIRVAAALCGGTAVAVTGVDEDHATGAIEAVASRLATR